MSKSKKSNSKNNSEVKTKAELQKAFEKTYDLLKEEEKKVARCQKQLEDARAKLTAGEDVFEQLELKEKELAEITIQLKEVSEQKYELEKKVEKLTLLNETLLKEKETLQRKAQEAELQKNNASEAEIESLRAELQQLGEENEALLQQLEEARGNAAQTSEIETLQKVLQQSKEDRTEFIHSNKEPDDDLKLKPAENERITTPDVESPSGEAGLFENEKEETGPLAQKESSEQAAVISTASVAINVLQDIQFLQSKRSLKVGMPLRANHPFSVLTRLQFPIFPTLENMDIDTSVYDIRIIVTDNNETQVIARNGIADQLSAGVRDYGNAIKIPGLKPGNYFLRISTLALFADIEENRKFELVVEG